MKCEGCGAPLDEGMERCPYCGTLVPVDESRLKLKQQEERLKKLEGLARMKYVPSSFLVIAYIFTAGLYSVYWYAMRIKDINNLDPDYNVKLPAWGVAIFGLLCCAQFLTEEIGIAFGLSLEQSDSVLNVIVALVILTSVWLAFRVRRIFQNYAAKYLDKAVAVGSVASSGVMLILFGAAYLQSQVNKMISMEILAPKI